MSQPQPDHDPQQIVDFYEELTTVLSSEDNEFKSIEQVAEYRAELEEVRQQKLDDVNKDIDALCQQCDEEAESLHQERKSLEEPQDVETQLKVTAEKKDEIKVQIAVLQSEVSQVEHKKGILEKEKQQIDQKIKKDLPSHRHDCNLYSNITGIRWQYDVEPHLVKGYISSKNRVKTFSLNSQQNSQQFIINYLWDQMETDW